jgi:2-polyprenyl-3-methyl-5-hydroxy-6-metoxy-1,4-benzoquinol methylase
MVSAFDVVISFGLVEHFEDTDACLKAINKFLAPKGLLITFIPNMVGFTGFLTKSTQQTSLRSTRNPK